MTGGASAERLRAAAEQAEAAIDAALDLAIDLAAVAERAGPDVDPEAAAQARRDALEIAATLRRLSDRAHGMADLHEPRGEG